MCARVFLCVPARTCVCVNMCVFCVCVCVCVCGCAFVRSTARARLCVVVYCVVFIIPASISAKLKFCIALIDYEATQLGRSSVNYDCRFMTE